MKTKKVSWKKLSDSQKQQAEEKAKKAAAAVPQYKRIGTCQPNKCGAFCCRMGPRLTATQHVSHRVKPDDYLAFELFFGVRKMGTVKVKGEKQNLYGLPIACQHLQGNRCGIYHKKRPNACHTFPEHPDHQWYLLAKQHGCTYRFVKIKKKRDIV